MFLDSSCTMALSLKDPEVDRLVREVAARTGETLTATVTIALRERLGGQPRREGGRDTREQDPGLVGGVARLSARVES